MNNNIGHAVIAIRNLSYPTSFINKDTIGTIVDFNITSNTYSVSWKNNKLTNNLYLNIDIELLPEIWTIY